MQGRQLEHLPHHRRRAQGALHDGQLVARRRVVDEHLEQEAVDLRLGQRVGALGLDRVLRRQHQERVGHGVGDPADRHLVLLHDLEQRRLHLRRGAVDLVGQQEVREDRAELDVEARLAGPQDAGADEVGGHQVGRELDAREAAADDVGDGAHGERLGQAGHALDEQVAAGEQRDEHPFEQVVLAGHDPADLEQRGLEGGLGRGRIEIGALGRHGNGGGIHAGSEAAALKRLVKPTLFPLTVVRRHSPPPAAPPCAS